MTFATCPAGEPGCTCAGRTMAITKCPAGEPGCTCYEWDDDPWDGAEREDDPRDYSRWVSDDEPW